MAKAVLSKKSVEKKPSTEERPGKKEKKPSPVALVVERYERLRDGVEDQALLFAKAVLEADELEKLPAGDERDEAFAAALLRAIDVATMEQRAVRSAVRHCAVLLEKLLTASTVLQTEPRLVQARLWRGVTLASLLSGDPTRAERGGQGWFMTLERESWEHLDRALSEGIDRAVLEGANALALEWARRRVRALEKGTDNAQKLALADAAFSAARLAEGAEALAYAEMRLWAEKEVPNRAEQRSQAYEFYVGMLLSGLSSEKLAVELLEKSVEWEAFELTQKNPSAVSLTRSVSAQVEALAFLGRLEEALAAAERWIAAAKLAADSDAVAAAEEARRTLRSELERRTQPVVAEKTVKKKTVKKTAVKKKTVKKKTVKKKVSRR